MAIKRRPLVCDAARKATWYRRIHAEAFLDAHLQVLQGRKRYRVHRLGRLEPAPDLVDELLHFVRVLTQEIRQRAHQRRCGFSRGRQEEKRVLVHLAQRQALAFVVGLQDESPEVRVVGDSLLQPAVDEFVAELGVLHPLALHVGRDKLFKGRVHERERPDCSPHGAEFDDGRDVG